MLTTQAEPIAASETLADAVARADAAEARCKALEAKLAEVRRQMIASPTTTLVLGDASRWGSWRIEELI